MENSNISWVKAFFMAFAMGAMGVVYFFRYVVNGMRWCINSGNKGRSAEVPGLRVVNATAMPVASPKAGAATETVGAPAPAAVQLQSAEFVAADRIVTIRLDPAVAAVHLRVYKALGLIKREMIVTEPRLRSLLQGRRHTLADVRYEASAGLEEIKDDTVRIVQELINLKGSTKVTRQRAAPEVPSTPKVAAKPQAKAVPKVVIAPAPIQAARQPEPSVNPPPEVRATQFVPKLQTGVTFEGCLVEAGTRKITPQGRDPYETFEAKLRLRNGCDVPMRGLELDRELQSVGATIGDMISITPMGKVPVTLATGKEAEKNMYRVVRMGESRQ